MPAAEEKKVQGILRKVPALAELPLEVQDRLAAAGRFVQFRARQVVYLPGDRAQGVFFIGAGRVKVSKVTRDGKELTLAYRCAGDFFGDPCLLDARPREEMVEAMEPTTTVEVDQQALESLLRTQVVASFSVIRTLLSRCRELETKVEQLIFKDVVSKLAELLLRLGSEHGVESKRGLALGLKITHQEMANLIGSTRETVSLTLSQFKRKGLLQTEGRRVILTDRDGLKSLS